MSLTLYERGRVGLVPDLNCLIGQAVTARAFFLPEAERAVMECYVRIRFTHAAIVREYGFMQDVDLKA